jgi:1-acyl-sn-glycerol-3-phosphate acyltransferase
MIKKFIVFLINTIFNLFTRRQIAGVEKVPTDKPAIIASNHIGFLDGIMIPSIPILRQHPNLIVVIAEKYENNWFFKWAIDNLNFMFIDRFNPDVKTMRKVLQLLKKDGILVIAPEGTRSPNAALIEGKSGTAYLAAKTGATIIPIGLTGTEDNALKDHLKKIKRLQVNIKVGDPFTIPQLPTIDREEFLQKYTDEIMCRIAALLPESYRGFYSQHPRLIEILNTP